MLRSLGPLEQARQRVLLRPWLNQNLCTARFVRVLVFDLSPFHFISSRPSTMDNSSRFQEIAATVAGDATSTLRTGSIDASFQESNRDDCDDAYAMTMETGNRNNISLVAENWTKSPPPASMPSSSSSSEYSEFYKEPDFQMTRANWWQGLVAIYHPNAEIGSKLVMADIVHL